MGISGEEENKLKKLLQEEYDAYANVDEEQGEPKDEDSEYRIGILQEEHDSTKEALENYKQFKTIKL